MTTTEPTPHVCRDSDGNPVTHDAIFDVVPVKPLRVTCGRCFGVWCERCDPTPSALCPFCDHGSSTATLRLPEAQQEPPAGRHDLGCPECGSTELETIEQIIGSCALSAWVEADDTRDMEFGGETDVWWDSSTSIRIECHHCSWSVVLDQSPDSPPHEEQIVALLKVVAE